MSTPGKRKTTVVLVMAKRDPALDRIQPQLDQLDVTLRLAANLQQFQQMMREVPPADVVITGVTLSDGNWCDVLTSTVRAGSTARVLVCCQQADERFWSEAIWRGVHDILVAPFTAEFLRRSVEIRGGRVGQGETDPDRGHIAEERRATCEGDRTALLVPAGA